MTDSLTHITVTTAEPPILPLVKRFFQSQGMRAQAAKVDLVIIARSQQKTQAPIIAALRLCPVKHSWILRSMSVAKNHQRQGIGQRMLRQIKAELAEKKCYCFAYPHLQTFYQQAGFQLCDERSASDAIRQLYLQYRQSGKDIVLMQYNTDIKN